MFLDVSETYICSLYWKFIKLQCIKVDSIFRHNANIIFRYLLIKWQIYGYTKFIQNWITTLTKYYCILLIPEETKIEYIGMPQITITTNMKIEYVSLILSTYNIFFITTTLFLHLQLVMIILYKIELKLCICNVGVKRRVSFKITCHLQSIDEKESDP